jgi:uncharacterized YigZ family protein
MDPTAVLRDPPIKRYRTPTGGGRAEFDEKRSLFIGSAGPAEDVDAAQAFIAGVRSEYPDATHHAWAYRLAPGPQGQVGSSDDGEPGGTAGRPMLAVIEGSGLAHVVVVGTRYFGGIKLGSGGLVRAYATAARSALSATPTEERLWHRRAAITIAYGVYGALRRRLPELGVRVEQERFAEAVSLVLAVPHDQAECTGALLADLTGGEVLLGEHWLEDEGLWAPPAL